MGKVTLLHCLWIACSRGIEEKKATKMREKSRSVIAYLKHACCSVDLQKCLEKLGIWKLKTIDVDSSEEKRSFFKVLQ